MSRLAGLVLLPGLVLAGCGSADSVSSAGEAAAPVERETSAPAATPTPSAEAVEAADARAKSDARNMAVLMEVHFTDVQAYPTTMVEGRRGQRTTVDILANGASWDSMKLKPGNTMSLRTDGSSFCITVTHPAASRPWVYDSQAGGIQTAPDATCGAERGPLILGA